MPKEPQHPLYVLTLSCPDRTGIVAAVGQFLVENGCNIVESAQYGEPANGRFFMRTGFNSLAGRDLASLECAFEPIADRYEMQVQFFDLSVPVRTLVMVSKLGHCLNDLLFRHRIGAMPIDLRLIVSNHGDFEGLANHNAIPFVYAPVTPETKAEAERAVIALIEKHDIELIVLARYMQVLSEDFCARYPGRIINIHHSFLPSFKGAKPYHRAHERGVKLIGATAHYVTADLDEGPIIEQGVERVRHNFAPNDLVAIGRDVESVVLARGVQWHAERRVLLNGHRTVIFQ